MIDQTEIHKANIANERYLMECEIARLREWKDKKCTQMLAIIDQMIHDELKRRIKIK